MSHTRYSESQEDQNMTKLLYFTRTQKRRRKGVSVCFGMEKIGNLYSCSGKNMNGKSSNEG